MRLHPSRRTLLVSMIVAAAALVAFGATTASAERPIDRQYGHPVTPPPPTYTFTRRWVGQTATTCCVDLTATWKHADVRVFSILYYYQYFPGDQIIYLVKGNPDSSFTPGPWPVYKTIRGNTATYRVTLLGGQFRAFVGLVDANRGGVASHTFANSTECTLKPPPDGF